MPLFFRRKKEKVVEVPVETPVKAPVEPPKPIEAPKKPISERQKRLDENAGCEFTTEILEDMKGSHIAYKYDKVECTITGNADGLKEGAALYVRRKGVVANVASEVIAQIQNRKLVQMVNDFFGSDSRFCNMRAKFVSIENDILYLNLGFFMNDEPIDYDEDDEDEEDEEDY